MTGDVILEGFVQARDAVLQTLDEAKIRAFYKDYPDVVLPEDAFMFWTTIHKAITAAVSMPPSARRRSKDWLTKRGFKSMDDGDL